MNEVIVRNSERGYLNMAASAKEKFDAAVNVIQSLPKNGSFQPSNDMLLRFYAFYKQATEGKCTKSKPSFWDVVGKAKWDAWMKLGSMPREEAMMNYVDELKQIIEAMPHTSSVTEFISKIGSFYETVEDSNKTSPRVKNGDVHNLTNGHEPTSETAQEFLKVIQPSESRRSESPTDSAHSSSDSIGTEQNSYVNGSNDIVVESGNLELKGPSLENGYLQNGHHAADGKAGPFQQANDSGLDEEGSEENAPVLPEASIRMVKLKQAESSSESEDSDLEEFCDTCDNPVTEELVEPTKHIDVSVENNDRLSSGEPELAKLASSTHQGELCSSRNTEMHQQSQSLQSPSKEVHYPSQSSKQLQPTPGSIVHFPEVSPAGRIRGGGSETYAWDSPTTSRHKVPSKHRQGGLEGQAHFQGQFTSGTGGIPPLGGSGGGDRDPSFIPPPRRSDVNDQVALALVRLQQDMNSVLSRLNTLEALVLAQHQIGRSRNTSESERQSQRVQSAWWWPFGGLEAKTILFLLAWPLVLRWFLFLWRRQRNRPQRM